MRESDGQTRQQWAVVGGGMLGLATALRLAERGESVTVFEGAPEIGGLASAWKLGEVEWDKYYHVVLLSDQALRELLEKIGLEKEIQWVTTRTGFYTDGRLHSLSSSLDFLKFRPLSLLQKFRLGCTILYASRTKPTKSLENTLVETWLRRLSGKKTFEKIWQPLLKAKLGPAYARTSAMFIWSYIDRMYKARRSGMKRELFGYVPGGYRRVLTALQKHLQELGVRIVTNAPVQSIVRDESIQKLRVELGGGDSNGVSSEVNSERLLFDRVVTTVPNPRIAASCPQLNNDESNRLTSAEYLGVTCTSLLLDRPLGGYYVTNITDAWVPLTGIIEMGSILPPERLGGNYLVYLPQYMASDDPRFEESDEQVHDRCVQTLEKMYPNFTKDQVKTIQTARAKYVMTLPILNYSEKIPPVVSSVPGLYLLNSSQITVGCLNVNEIIEIAHRELEQSVFPDAKVVSA